MRTNHSMIFTPEEFLYLKSVFAIKDAVHYSNSIDYFYGNLYGETVMSESFEKGKYTL